MDYEFRRDDPFGAIAPGSPWATGHRPVADRRAGKDEEKLDELFAIIDQLSGRTRTEYRLLGGDYSCC